LKAARFYRVGDPLRVEEVVIPKISPEEVLVKIKVCGICRTDIHFIDEGLLKPGKIPQIMGHEAAGDIVEVGKDVSDLNVGDRVLIHFYFSCGDCYYCRRGRESLCVSPNFQQFGFTVDGGYAEYAKAPGRSIVKLPPEVPYEAGILGDAGSTAFHAVREVGKVRIGDIVVIMGCGGVGLCTLQMAKLNGARVIAVDINGRKLEIDKSLGADCTINSLTNNLSEEIRKLVGDRGVDFVFEFVGVKKTMYNSLKILVRGGKLVFIGYSDDKLLLDPRKLIVGERQILGSRASSKHETIEVVELVREGKFRLNPLISHRIPLPDINDGLELVRKGEAIRAVVIPT
jgi:propanol-preferring alcohol dehydrogenase